ncbi:MAG TPA: DUF362 domain-containing protein [Chthonomonadaceae bacterium]|nr:DUF362 domain-containing protein [Chthonomonadaceae bacterium]
MGPGSRGWLWRIGNMLVPPEPPLPATVLGAFADRLGSLPAGATVCIKVSAAHDLPYPFSVSGGFVRQVVEEIRATNGSVRVLLTEGGVGRQPAIDSARAAGLLDIPGAEFVDAEEGEQVFAANPLDPPHSADGFWLPAHWLAADARVLLTTCKLRSHHFQRWYSGGARNLIGLLCRERYKLPSSRRQMRSVIHQRGMDAMVADLYATAGRNVTTVLDARLVARQDEHLPLRFVRRFGRVVVAGDPYDADCEMTSLLELPFVPPYLERIAESRRSGAEVDSAKPEIERR